MKRRKPSLSQQKEEARLNLVSEIKLKKICLEVANKKIDTLAEQIRQGDTSKKTRKALEDQVDVARNIKTWLATATI